MVWDIHEVREAASCTQHNANISPQAPFQPYSPLLHLPRIQKRAGGGSLWHFGGIPMSLTSLAGKSEPEVHLYDVWAQLPTSASSSFLAGERSRLPREQHMTF